MPARLKHVDPNRPPGRFSRAYAAFSNTRLGRFLSIYLVWKLDPPLMRATRGRADRVFAPYAAYRCEAAEANRTIPIVQLTLMT